MVLLLENEVAQASSPMSLTFQKVRPIDGKTIQINDRQMNDRNIRVGNHQKNHCRLSFHFSAFDFMALRP
jgi:hypothetical protein